MLLTFLLCVTFSNSQPNKNNSLMPPNARMATSLNDSLDLMWEKRGYNPYFSFCRSKRYNPLVKPLDAAMVMAHELIHRKYLAQLFKIKRPIRVDANPTYDKAAAIVRSRMSETKKDTTLTMRFYYVNPDSFNHLDSMVVLLDQYEKIKERLARGSRPIQDSEFRFLKAYVIAEKALRFPMLSRKIESDVRTSLVQAAIYFFDESRNNENLKEAVYTAFLESAEVLIDLSFKETEGMDNLAKSEYYRTAIKMFLERAVSPPVLKLQRRFEVLEKSLNIDPDNTLVALSYFRAKCAQDENRLGAAAYYLTMAITSKKSYPRFDLVTYSTILSLLYSDKAAIFQLADYNQEQNLFMAIQFYRIAFSFSKDPTTRSNYAKALCQYAEIMEKMFDFPRAKEYIDIALSIDPNIPHINFVAANIYDELFYIHQAINYSKTAVRLGTEQHNPAKFTLYDPQKIRLTELYKELGQPGRDKLTKRAEFEASTQRAKKELADIGVSIQQTEIKDENSRTGYTRQLDSVIKRLLLITNELKASSVKEQQVILDELTRLRKQTESLKQLVTDFFLKTDQ